MVIATGMAGDREEICLEKCARNKISKILADNDGFYAKDEKIDPSGEDKLFSSLPLKSMREVGKSLKTPCRFSYSAGEYVCNLLMYKLLRQYRRIMPVGFIHLPATRQIKSVSHLQKNQLVNDFTQLLLFFN